MSSRLARVAAVVAGGHLGIGRGVVNSYVGEGSTRIRNTHVVRVPMVSAKR